MNYWITLAISFVTDFVIVSGSTVAGGALGQGQVPSKGVWILAAVSGAVAAARRVQALLTPTPQNNGGAK